MRDCKVGTRVSVKYSRHARHSFPRLGPISALIFVVSPQPLLFERGRSIVLFKSVTLTLLKSCRNFWQCWTLLLIVVGAVLHFSERTLCRHLAALHLLCVREILQRFVVVYDLYYFLYCHSGTCRKQSLYDFLPPSSVNEISIVSVCCTLVTSYQLSLSLCAALWLRDNPLSLCIAL